jgi:hypothetical protein
MSHGIAQRRLDGRGQVALIAAGIAMFAVRSALWLTHTWPG